MDIHELIEIERTRLMRAEAFLECLAICLEQRPPCQDEPDYSEVAKAIRVLLRDTINNLDSVKLRTFFACDVTNSQGIGGSDP